MNFIWHNGEFKDEGAAVFAAHDRIRLGDGVFDTMLVVVEGESSETPAFRLIHADLHLPRILHNASLLEIRPLPTIDDIRAACEALIEKNKLAPGCYALNTVISRGVGERGLKIPEEQNPNIVISLSPVPDESPPAHAVIARTVRRNEGSPLSHIKSCNYGDHILALKEAEERGANEAIMLNNHGFVTCATSSNIFAVIDGALVTPPLEDGVMNGVVRQLLIERYDVREQSLTEDELKAAQGMYLTNSIRGAVPVLSLDGQNFPPSALEIDKDFHLQ